MTLMATKHFILLVMNTCILSIAGAILPLTEKLNAQQADPDSSSFSIQGRAHKPVRIPFELINNLILIDVSINGSAPLKLILDTGVGNVLITSIPVGEELYLESTRTVTLSGLGKGEPVEAFYSTANKLNINRIEGDNVDVLFLKEDIFQISLYMGTYVHGIIGYELFKNFAVEINYFEKELLLYDPDIFERKFRKLAKHRRWFKFPISVVDRKPYLNIKYKHKPGAPYIPVRLLIDSGSSIAFSLYGITNEKIQTPKVNIQTLLGMGLSGEVHGKLGRVQKMKIGNAFELKKPIVAFPDSQSVQRTFNLGNRNGSLGGGVLRRFKVIFHYRDGYILMRKNKNFGKNFYYNISGIEVNTPIPNIPLYVVSEVRENSLADKKGIQKGDIIQYINGKPTGGMNLNEVLTYIQKSRGVKIILGISRNGKYKEVRLKLRNELTVDN